MKQIKVNVVMRKGTLPLLKADYNKNERKYLMSNKMKSVSELLGLKLGEHFKIKENGKIGDFVYVLRENGLFCILNGEEKDTCGWLDDLLTGKLEVVKFSNIPRCTARPKLGERYYRWINSNVDRSEGWFVTTSIWNNDTFDIANFAMGNCFHALEEAEFYKDEVVVTYSSYTNALKEEMKNE